MINFKYTPSDNPIEIKCKGHMEFALEELIAFQGGLKTLTEENREKLATSIIKNGFCAPLFVWIQDGTVYLIDGHQRISVLNWMKETGWHIPEIPVAVISAETEEEARQKVLAISSQYGDFDAGVLAQWVSELYEDDNEMLRLFTDDGEVFYEDGEMFLYSDDTEQEREEKENPYTGKIEAPIYEPTMEKPPEISDLFDRNKTMTLAEEIREENIEDKELEKFLLNAAQRHTVFSYDKIAEYYSHAPANIQRLMEKSALVIIDYNSAVENGFAKFLNDFSESYEENISDEE